MKFAKIYGSTFQGSLGQDWRLRSLWWDLLALCDWHGRIKDDYGGIAAKTCRNIDDVVNGMAELMKPDPCSRSKKLEGRRVWWIDEKRPQRGFQIVNYAKYRDRGRRDRAGYMRQYRGEKRNQGVTTALPPRNHDPPSKCNQGVTTALPPRNHKNKTEEESKKKGRNELGVRTTLLANGSHDSDLIQDFAIAKAEISKQIFSGRLSEKHWTHEALRALDAQMPMKKSEIWTVGFHMSEVPPANPPSLTMLLRWWPDRYTKAAAWEEANFPS
jgi:hypothetical protein